MKHGVGMRAVDTNVVVRCLTGDNCDQGARERAAIGEVDLSAGKAALLESRWMLRRVFNLPGTSGINTTT